MKILIRILDGLTVLFWVGIFGMMIFCDLTSSIVLAYNQFGSEHDNITSLIFSIMIAHPIIRCFMMWNELEFNIDKGEVVDVNDSDPIDISHLIYIQARAAIYFNNIGRCVITPTYPTRKMILETIVSEK